MASLTYYIFEGVLIGNAGGKGVHFWCGSGGGAGATRAKTTTVANNPYATGIKQPAPGQVDPAYRQARGGPIPLGKYKLVVQAKHAKFGRCCYLEPQTKLPNQRGGFFIHAVGPRGSDGCLVLPRPDLDRLLDAIAKDGGGTLIVQEATDGSRFA